MKAYGYVVRDDYVVAWAFKKQPDLSKWKVAPKRSQVGDSAIAYVPTKKNELYDNLKKSCLLGCLMVVIFRKV